MPFQASHFVTACQARHAAWAVTAPVAHDPQGASWLLLFAATVAVVAAVMFGTASRLWHQAIAVMVEAVRVTVVGICLVAIVLLALYAAYSVTGNS